MYGSSFIQSSIGHIVYVTGLKGVRPSVFRMRDTDLLFDVDNAITDISDIGGTLHGKNQ